MAIKKPPLPGIWRRGERNREYQRYRKNQSDENKYCKEAQTHDMRMTGGGDKLRVSMSMLVYEPTQELDTCKARIYKANFVLFENKMCRL